jgi:gas vesicle protein
MGSGFVIGLLTGAAAGALAGLLFAPQKGSELRDQLSGAAASAGESLSTTVDNLKQSGGQLYVQARDAAGRAVSEVDRAAHAG